MFNDKINIEAIEVQCIKDIEDQCIENIENIKDIENQSIETIEDQCIENIENQYIDAIELPLVYRRKKYILTLTLISIVCFISVLYYISTK